MDNKTFHYPYGSSLEEKVIAVLKLFKEPTIEEITAELIELQGIASEEGVAECSVSVEEVLNSLVAAGKVQVSEANKTKRYTSTS